MTTRTYQELCRGGATNAGLTSTFSHQPSNKNFCYLVYSIRLESCEIKSASQLGQQSLKRDSTENLTSFTFGPSLGKDSPSPQACIDFFHQFCQDEISLEL